MSGRPRSPESHQAVLDATEALLREHGYPALTIEKVALRAGVGKRTIYRWWSSKGALVAEAFGQSARERHPDVDTGQVRADLVGFLATLFAEVARPGKGTALRSMMAEAQLDQDFAAEFGEFVAARREVLRGLLTRGVRRGELRSDADLDVAIDALFGTFWYRLLVGHLPLDASTADALAATLLDGLSPRR
jgi:AcrR family transcriptional regulator